MHLHEMRYIKRAGEAGIALRAKNTCKRFCFDALVVKYIHSEPMILHSKLEVLEK